ncbi:MAG TPA: 3-phosphoshikimate 1-carboxyvinyltransferase, partial [Planctomycetota bacterium]|nr:3-phosphoshikimate 1-carboxyvinyltransferase [Planctomycetota bacterium]
IILASIAEGKSTLRNVPLSDDCLAVIKCIKQLGVKTELTGQTLAIYGNGRNGLRKPSKPLNVGESGTAARLLTGLLAGQRFTSVITGKKTLLKRPMNRVIEPLSLMGANIKSKGGRLPLKIYPATLKGIKYTMPMASAQVKSAILFAGLYADGETVVREKIPTRDHTERLLRLMSRSNPKSEIRNPKLRAVDIQIPGDFSSAAYFIAAGLLVPGSDIIIKNVGLNPYRIGLLTVLKKMGSAVSCILHPASCIHGSEPIGNVRVRFSSLRGVTISGKMIPSLIDEIPILALIATQARGTTIIKGAGELRVKETDRINAIVTELAKLGADIKETSDGMIIKGPTKLHGASCVSHNDHRMAMTLSIAGLIAEGVTRIQGAEVVNKSFPSFWKSIECRQR